MLGRGCRASDEDRVYRMRCGYWPACIVGIGPAVLGLAIHTRLVGLDRMRCWYWPEPAVIRDHGGIKERLMSSLVLQMYRGPGRKHQASFTLNVEAWEQSLMKGTTWSMERAANTHWSSYRQHMVSIEAASYLGHIYGAQPLDHDTDPYNRTGLCIDDIRRPAIAATDKQPRLAQSTSVGRRIVRLKK